MLWITIITTIITITTLTAIATIITIIAIIAIIIAVISILILSTHIIISRIMEIRTIHRTTVQHPRQADMAPHRVLFMEVRATVMASAMERHRITARAQDMEMLKATIRALDMEAPRATSRVQAMETRTVTMEHMEAIPVIRVMHMAAIQNRRRKRKKENRVDLENSLQNVQHLHLYLDWLQAVS